MTAFIRSLNNMVHRKEVFLSDQARIKNFWILHPSLKEFYFPTCISLSAKWQRVWPILWLTFWRKEDGCASIPCDSATVILCYPKIYRPLSDFQLSFAFYILNQRPLPLALLQSIVFILCYLKSTAWNRTRA